MLRILSKPRYRCNEGEVTNCLNSIQTYTCTCMQHMTNKISLLFGNNSDIHVWRSTFTGKRSNLYRFRFENSQKLSEINSLFEYSQLQPLYLQNDNTHKRGYIITIKGLFLLLFEF